MFLQDLHVQYIRKISSDTVSFEYLVTQHLRMSGVYWGLTALSILGSGLEDNDIASESSALNVSTVDKTIIDWIMSCQDSESGGFGGNTSHDPHILYTLSAIQILALYDSLHLVDVQKVALYVKSLEQEDGSFFGDKWGEVDTRFSYCALSILSLTGQLHSGIIDIPRAVTFIERCRNFDGGFGAVPGAESHAGQIFCCVGALSIAGALSSVNHDLLGWWLSERQCDSGGLNGRPEKQPDVCYSWWILSTLSILGRTSWIDCDKLTDFILRCQDADGGGISDRPGNMSDVFHTFFGICGLSLMKRFEAIPSTNGENSIDSNGGGGSGSYRAIDPTYALPVDVIRRLGVTAQTLATVS